MKRRCSSTVNSYYMLYGTENAPSPPPRKPPIISIWFCVGVSWWKLEWGGGGGIESLYVWECLQQLPTSESNVCTPATRSILRHCVLSLYLNSLRSTSWHIRSRSIGTSTASATTCARTSLGRTSTTSTWRGGPSTLPILLKKHRSVSPVFVFYRSFSTHRIEWFIEDQASCRRMVWLPSLSPVNKLSLFLSIPVCCWSSLLTGRGWGRSQSISLQERLDLHKIYPRSFSTVLFGLVYPDSCFSPTYFHRCQKENVSLIGTGSILDPDPHRSTLICFSWIWITIRFGSTDLDAFVMKFQ